MSKENSISPDSSEMPAVEAAGKPRAAKSRSGKLAKSAKAAESAPEELPIEKTSPPSTAAYDLDGSGVFNETQEVSEASPHEKTKRKRRRKKSKGGGGSQNVAPASSGEVSSEAAEQATAGEATAQRQAAKPSRLKLDSEAVAKLAWKIFLAEVSEEGVALIGDNDAKELSRRCFRLAEIFMEEQARRG